MFVTNEFARLNCRRWFAENVQRIFWTTTTKEKKINNKKTTHSREHCKYARPSNSSVQYNSRWIENDLRARFVVSSSAIYN